MTSRLSAELARIVKLLVDDPDAVRIQEVPSRDGMLLRLEAAPDDLGKVIGRQGRTVRALRCLLDERGAHDDESYELDIVDD